MKRKFCMIISCLLFSVLLSLITPMQAKAFTVVFPIDTSSKITTQSSIVYIFDNFEELTEVPDYINYDSDLDAWKLFNFMEALYFENSDVSQNEIQALLFNFNISYTTSTVSELYSEVRPFKTWYYVNDNSYLGRSSFSDNWETVNFVLRVIRYNRGTRYIPPFPPEPPTPSPIYKTYGPFLRFFNGAQSVYGYDQNYTPKISFNYTYGVFNNVDIQMTLIDDDKLIIEHGDTKIYMDKNTHYSRNTHQPNFPSNFTSFKNLYDFEESSAYFHKIALYNGDTSNFANKKYHVTPSSHILNKWSNSKYEVVYSADNKKEENSLVYGTFNYYNTGINHYLYDVYPYLIWGNDSNDTSLIRERMHWDYDAWRLGSAYKYRGSTLYQTYQGKLRILENDLIKLEGRV